MFANSLMIVSLSWELGGTQAAHLSRLETLERVRRRLLGRSNIKFPICHWTFKRKGCNRLRRYREFLKGSVTQSNKQFLINLAWPLCGNKRLDVAEAAASRESISWRK
jgi:hypothetical protein